MRARIEADQRQKQERGSVAQAEGSNTGPPPSLKEIKIDQVDLTGTAPEMAEGERRSDMLDHTV